MTERLNGVGFVVLLLDLTGVGRVDGVGSSVCGLGGVSNMYP